MFLLLELVAINCFASPALCSSNQLAAILTSMRQLGHNNMNQSFHIVQAPNHLCLRFPWLEVEIEADVSVLLGKQKFCCLLQN